MVYSRRRSSVPRATIPITQAVMRCCVVPQERCPDAFYRRRCGDVQCSGGGSVSTTSAREARIVNRLYIPRAARHFMSDESSHHYLYLQVRIYPGAESGPAQTSVDATPTELALAAIAQSAIRLGLARWMWSRCLR